MISLEKLLLQILILSIFYLWFRWHHRGDNNYQIKRIILLSLWICSLIIPFLSWQIIPVDIVPGLISSPGKIFSNNGLQSSFSTGKMAVLEMMYLSGVIIYLGFFLTSFLKIINRLSHYTFLPHSMNSKICWSEERISFSFFHFIVLRKAADDIERFHEEGHVTYGHTWDLIIAEILTGLSWFNPIAYLMKKLIKENHEFQADHYALEAMKESPLNYAEILYKILLEKQVSPIVHSFNSQIASRINHLKLNQKPKMMKYLFSLLFFAIFSSAFTIKTYPRILDGDYDEISQNADTIIIRDTIVVFDFQDKTEKIEIVESRHSLTEYVERIKLSGKMVEIRDTMIIFHADNLTETMFEKIQIIPVELEVLYKSLAIPQQNELIKQYGTMEQKKISN